MLKIKASRLSHVVKADRVNALRKQYDAFLEEDKKRKERNEYILGKLDNMRYTTTAVQIRYKPIVYGDVMPVFNRGVFRPDPFENRDIKTPHLNTQVATPRDFKLDIPRHNLDNSALLKEISKKYILIPKLRSSLVNEYVGTIPPQSLPPIAVSSPQTNSTSNEDWKSKYDILDQLKTKEKEEVDKYVADDFFPVKENETLSSDKIIPKRDIGAHKSPISGDSYALQSYDTKEVSTKYEYEAPEKDVISENPKAETETQNVEKHKISDRKSLESSAEQAPKSSASINSEANITYKPFDEQKLKQSPLENYGPVDSVQETSYNYSEDLTPTEYIKEDLTSHIQMNTPPKEEYPVQYEPSVEMEGKYPDSENVYLDRDDYSPIQVLEPTSVVEQTLNESVVNDNADVNDENPVEMINVQDFTPKNDVKLIDGVNVNPQYEASKENIDPAYENNPEAEVIERTAVDSSDIEAFDAEQREMFYSEDAQYDYDQQQSDVYNQENSNAPDQDNTYYESAAALQEQEYPVEINEHEESNTRYDQSYEEQYAADYVQQVSQGQEQQQYVQHEGYDQSETQQYVQPEGYDQTEHQQYVQPEGYDQTEHQQYVQPEGYDQTEHQQYVQPEVYDQNEPQQYFQQEGYDQAEQDYQGYEYQQQDHDTIQNIEQALDNEQGYVDHQNSEIKQEQKPALDIQVD